MYVFINLFFIWENSAGVSGRNAGWGGGLKATSGRVLFQSAFKGQGGYFIGQVHHSMFGKWLRWING